MRPVQQSVRLQQRHVGRVDSGLRTVEMAGHRSSGHAKNAIRHHVAWITECRWRVLRGSVAERARENSQANW